ncbi:MAG: hypothetical protein ACRCZJ_05265 [Erysipelotrichaceae bacterium]
MVIKLELLDFMDKMEQALKPMEKEELIAFVLQYARRLGDEERTNLYHTIDEFRSEKNNVLRKKTKQSHTFQTVLDCLEEIAHGETYVTYKYVEDEWSDEDWYDLEEQSEDEQACFQFQDPFNLIDTINEILTFVKEAMHSKKYAQVIAIFKRLEALQIEVVSDIWEGPVSLRRLEDEFALVVPCRLWHLWELYARYCDTQPESRAEELYRMIQTYDYYPGLLEEMMQLEFSLPDIEQFLPLWIAYLGAQPSKLAYACLQDALRIANKESNWIMLFQLPDFKHAALFEQYLKRNDAFDHKEAYFMIGNQGLQASKLDMMLHTRIANLLIEKRMSQDKAITKDIVELWQASYRVYPQSRIAQRLKEYMEEELALAFIKQSSLAYLVQFEHVDVRGMKEATKRMDEILLGSNHALYQLFLQGEYQAVMRYGVDKSETLGIGSGFMKPALKLFLLLMVEDTTTPACTWAMKSLHNWFGDHEVETGINYRIWEQTSYEKTKIELELLKANHSLTSKQTQESLDWIADFIKARTVAIMERSYTNYYEECALYIVLLNQAYIDNDDAVKGLGLIEEMRDRFAQKRKFNNKLRELHAYDGLAPKKYQKGNKR